MKKKSDWTFNVGKTRKILTKVFAKTLQQHIDVFIGLGKEMQASIQKSSLINEYPKIRSAYKAKKGSFNPKKQKAIKNEVSKLYLAGFIHEVDYLDWLANVVMVKKEYGKWKMFFYVTNLNKTCPKDSYLLPNIDQLDNFVGILNRNSWRLILLGIFVPIGLGVFSFQMVSSPFEMK